MQLWRAVDEQGQEREGYTFLVHCGESEINVCSHNPISDKDPKKLHLLITRHFTAHQSEDLERIRRSREQFERDEPLYKQILA